MLSPPFGRVCVVGPVHPSPHVVASRTAGCEGPAALGPSAEDRLCFV